MKRSTSFSVMFLLLLALAVIPSGVCTVGPVYENREYGFAFHPPQGWDSRDGSEFDVVVYFLGPRDDNFTVNIFIEVVPSALPRDQYLNATKDELRTVLDAYIYSERQETVNEHSVDVIEYLYTYETRDVLGLHYVWFVNGKVYLFTYTALSTTFNTYLGDVQDSYATFELIPIASFSLPLEFLIGIPLIVGVGVGLVVLVRRRRRSSASSDSSSTSSVTPPPPPEHLERTETPALPQPRRRQFFCTECGHQIRAGITFCENCGTPVS